MLPAQPFDPAAPALSDDIPLMIGGTKDEAAIFFAPDDAVWNRTVTEDELRKRVGSGRRRGDRRACSPTTSGAIRRRARPIG